MTTPIRILVADDHPIVRDGLISILGTQPDFDVVGKAGDGRETLEQVENLHPNVLLLDLEMPQMDGVETLRHLRDTHSAVRTIVFTAFDTDERIVSAVQAGAQGYLLKVFHARKSSTLFAWFMRVGRCCNLSLLLSCSNRSPVTAGRSPKWTRSHLASNMC
jgi:DNA-binding NarL/FixJ family response regulator